jgi:hypothetical protein
MIPGLWGAIKIISAFPPTLEYSESQKGWVVQVQLTQQYFLKVQS